jgi:magnesium-transporting ATPase (P-type)
MEKDLLKKSPRNPDERITDSPFFKKVGLISLVMAISGFVIYYYYGMPAVDGTLNLDTDEIKHLLRQAQTAAFTTVILVHLCYVITARSITESAFTFSPFSNRWMLAGIAITIAMQLESAFTFSPFSNRWMLAGIAITIAMQLGIIYHPIGNAILGTAPLPLDWWGLMILVALPGFFVIEIEKWLTKRFVRERGVAYIL